MGQEWTNAKNPPEAGVPVIALGKNGAGKVRRIRACYIPKYFMEDYDNSFSGDADYNEDNDTFTGQRDGMSGMKWKKHIGW